MTNKDFTKLFVRLLTASPEFVVKAPLAVICPIDHSLRGFYFESSSFTSASFYVWVFILPLYVPRQHISFELGHRLRDPRHSDGWSTDSPNLIAELGAAVKHQALPFLASVDSVEDVAKIATDIQIAGYPYAQQAAAYSWARAGNVQRALVELDRLIGMLDAHIAWQHEMSQQAATLRSKLKLNPLDAQRQLDEWEAESIKNLKLERSCQ